MMPTEYDHLFAGGLILLSAMLAAGSAPKQADSAQRWGFYRQAWLTGAAMVGLSLLVWAASGRPLQAFGLVGWSGDRPVATAAAALAWAAGLAVVVGRVANGMGRARLRSIYGKFEALMPATSAELRGSWGAAVSAGAGEEVAYRGFLLWYVAALAGPVAALLATSLVFGLAHGYQRATGIVFASAAGLVLGGALLISGSLLLVIWMHATYNVASFTIGKLVLANGSAAPDIGSAARQEAG